SRTPASVRCRRCNGVRCPRACRAGGRRLRSVPRSLLALSLLVPGVRTDHPDRAATADDLAAVAHLLDRWANLHPTPDLSYLYRYTIRPRVRSYGESSTSTRSPGRIRM